MRQLNAAIWPLLLFLLLPGSAGEPPALDLFLKETGAVVAPVTPLPSPSDGISLSPDGQWLAYRFYHGNTPGSHSSIQIVRRDGTGRLDLTSKWLDVADLLRWEKTSDSLLISGLPWGTREIQGAAIQLKKHGVTYHGKGFFIWRVGITGKPRALLPYLDSLPPESASGPRRLVVRRGKWLEIRSITRDRTARISMDALSKQLHVPRAEEVGALWRPGRPEVLVHAVASPELPAGHRAVLLSAEGRILKQFPKGMAPVGWSPDGRIVAFVRPSTGDVEEVLITKPPFKHFQAALSRAELSRAYGGDTIFIHPRRPVLLWLRDHKRMVIQLEIRRGGEQRWSLWLAGAVPENRKELLPGARISIAEGAEYLLLDRGGRLDVLRLPRQ